MGIGDEGGIEIREVKRYVQGGAKVTKGIGKG